MKNAFLKLGTLLGAFVYYVIALVLRVPTFVILGISMPIFLLFIAPFKSNEEAPKWMTKLYDWYKGK